MKRPTNAEKCLAILVLRSIGESVTNIVITLSCARYVVVNTGKWFEQLPYEHAVAFCDEAAITRAIERNKESFQQTRNGLPEKAAEVTADDILRHYRLTDYLEHQATIRQNMKKEALQKHFDAIRDLIERWREQLLPTRENVINPILGSFSKNDVKPGQHRNAPLNWIIREDGPTTVWLDVEDDRLFDALKIHLPNKELWDEYTELKELLCIEIDTCLTVSWNKGMSRIEAAEKLVESIDSLLEAEASKSIYPEKCRWCPDLD